MKKAFTLLAALAAMVASTAGAQEVKGDAQAGSKKVAMCIGCHGIPGYQASFPELYKVPMIAGQNAKYIAAALTAYQKGDRKHPTMRGIAASLSAQDIADVAAFYENQGKAAGGAPVPATLATPLPDALKDKMQICTSCHGPNFSSPIDGSYPKLAGQHADYLFAALKAYGTDGNANVGRATATMRSQVVQEADGKKKPTFTPAELKQIAAYLSSLPGELKTVPQSKMR